MGMNVGVGEGLGLGLAWLLVGVGGWGWERAVSFILSFDLCWFCLAWLVRVLGCCLCARVCVWTRSGEGTDRKERGCVCVDVGVGLFIYYAVLC